MPSYKLYYFETRGVAELSRLLLSAGGAPFEDIRYSREEWPKHKEEMPLKAMPVLEIDGVKYCESDAINRYLAREFGLYGETSMETLRIDEIYEALNDLKQAFMKVYHTQDETEKAKLLKTVLEETCPKMMTFLEWRLCENGGVDGYFVGTKLSLADIAVFHAVSSYNGALKMFGASPEVDIIANYTKLKDLCRKVESEPRIAEWLEKRPQTTM